MYNTEKNILQIISLLKAYGIRKVIASPGGTNLSFVASIQEDPFFEMYSCVDERSAAYMACGLAEESGEAVVISCTGATAARNYMPALTEAFYRKLPIIALTASRSFNHVGHLFAQMTDRNTQPNDIVIRSVQIQAIKSENDTWDCNIKLNKALSELYRHGGGPIHINYETSVSRDYSVLALPTAKKINRFFKGEQLPEIEGKSVSIFVGAHHKWSEREENAVDAFCVKYNASVYCDHSSNYKGKNRVLTSLIGLQKKTTKNFLDVDVLIHIGEVSGGYDAHNFNMKEVWRVNEDGEIRDLFGSLTNVFEMHEVDFFEYYGNASPASSSKSIQLHNYYQQLVDSIPELPFSNMWVASTLSKRIPNGSVLHLGILNSLRSWNCFEIPVNVASYSNTGGFGIDGIVSTLVGASLYNKNKLYFACLGDLAFFYDLNSIGNRHINNNLRILLINNGHGQEFCNYISPGSTLNVSTDEFVAAAGHFGSKSPTFVKHMAEDLGFIYLNAKNKEDFYNHMDLFISKNSTKPIIFEIFTDTNDENKALKLISELKVDIKFVFKQSVKGILKKISCR